MSAGVLAEDISRCLQAGMDDYLAKPFLPEQLAAMLEKWLARVGASPQ